MQQRNSAAQPSKARRPPFRVRRGSRMSARDTSKGIAGVSNAGCQEFEDYAAVGSKLALPRLLAVDAT
jgi:hypothetical protein